MVRAPLRQMIGLAWWGCVTHCIMSSHDVILPLFMSDMSSIIDLSFQTTDSNCSSSSSRQTWYREGERRREKKREKENDSGIVCCVFFFLFVYSEKLSVSMLAVRAFFLRTTCWAEQRNHGAARVSSSFVSCQHSLASKKQRGHPGQTLLVLFMHQHHVSLSCLGSSWLCQGTALCQVSHFDTLCPIFEWHDAIGAWSLAMCGHALYKHALFCLLSHFASRGEMNLLKLHMQSRCNHDF